MPKPSRSLGTDTEEQQRHIQGVLVSAPPAAPRKNLPMDQLLERSGALHDEPSAAQLSAQPASPVTASERYAVVEIAVDRIKKSPYQPRLTFDEEKLHILADSIQCEGLEKPIVVRPMPDGDYELVGGERRWRAHRILHWPTIRAFVRAMTDAEAKLSAMADNEGQEELSDFERGRKYQQILDEGLEPSARALGRRLGVSPSTMNRCLGYMQLPAEIIDMLEANQGMIGTKAVRSFIELAATNKKIAIAAAVKIRDEGLSQEAALTWARKQLKPAIKPEAPKELFSDKGKVADMKVKGRQITLSFEAGYDAEKVGQLFAEFLAKTKDEVLHPETP